MRVLDDDLDRMDREKLITEASACEQESASTATVQVMTFVGKGEPGGVKILIEKRHGDDCAY